jgi:hypothetical protein
MGQTKLEYAGRARDESVWKFGYNGDIAQTAEPIWDQGDGYAYQSPAAVVNVSSSSTADDAASTGAKTILVVGVDSNGAYAEDTITMDGQLTVNSTVVFARVFGAYVVTAGSGGTNAGDIYIHDDPTTASGVPNSNNIYAKILAGEGQTQMALYTVPISISGETVEAGYITHATFSTPEATEVMTFRVRMRTSGGAPWRTLYVLSAQAQTIDIDHSDAPIRITAASDLQVTASVSGAGTAIGSAALYIVHSIES